LLEICSSKKEIKLKYELEKNVNLVRFENKRIEISFNEDLDKDFIKDLSSKLYEWTNDRWIITLSKTKGHPSKKEEEIILKKELIETVKKSPIYIDILKNNPNIIKDQDLKYIYPNLNKQITNLKLTTVSNMSIYPHPIVLKKRIK